MQAMSRSLPRYCVFSDGVLKQLVSSRPTTKPELLAISGLGHARCDIYGDDITRLVRSCVHAHEVAALAQPQKPAKVVIRHQGPRPAKHHPKPFFRPITVPSKPAPGKPAFVPCTPATARSAADLALMPPTKRSRAVFSVHPRPQDDDVYILELAQGKVYVGKSTDVARRVGQHTSGCGAAWTKAYPPTGVLLPRLGNVRGSGDAAERDETLRYMFLRGITNVRGWRYVAVNMSQASAPTPPGL